MTRNPDRRPDGRRNASTRSDYSRVFADFAQTVAAVARRRRVTR